MHMADWEFAGRSTPSRTGSGGKRSRFGASRSDSRTTSITPGSKCSSAAASPLRIGVEPAAGNRPYNGFQRQSAGVILFAFVRTLPFWAAISATLWYLIRRLFPTGSGFLFRGWSASLMTVILAFGWGLTLWLTSKWQLSDDRLVIRRGVFLRREASIHRSAIQSAEVERTPMTALTGASRLRIRTADRHSDELLLPGSGASSLAARLIPSGAGHTHSYRAHPHALWLAAAGGEGLTAFYSAAAPVLSASRDISGQLLERGLTALVTSEGLVYTGAVVLGMIWLLKVAHTRITLARMNFSLSGGTLMLRRGVISRRTESLSAERICALDIRTSLPGFLFGRRSCAVVLAGEQSYGLLPPVGQRRLRIESAAISPHGARVCTVSPLSAGIAYAAGRWLACLSLLPVISLVRRALPSLSATVPAIGITAAGLLLWRALVTTISAHRAGLVLFTDCAELTGVRRLSLHTLRVFRQSTGMVRITQSPLSRMLGRCTLRITPRGNRRAAVSCIKLPLERTLAACERII